MSYERDTAPRMTEAPAGPRPPFVNLPCDTTSPIRPPSYQRDTYAPRWARWLGLRLDWQSRPTSRTRTYHSRERWVELTLGWRGFQWALELQRWEDRTVICLGVPWVQLFVKVGSGAVPPAGEVCTSWGVQLYEGRASLDCGDGRRWGFELNPFRWDGYHHERMLADGTFDATSTYSEAGQALDWHIETLPYAIAGDPQFVGAPGRAPAFVPTWSTIATCYIERSTRTRRWLPFWQRVEWWVDVHLDTEIGPGRGTWKGGTVGFSTALLPGDDVATALKRAASEGRGR